MLRQIGTSGFMHMKTKASYFLAIFIILLLSACGQSDNNQVSQPSTEQETKTESTVQETSAETDSDEDAKRGLSGKKGSSEDTTDSKLTLSDREIKVYDGHLDTVVLIYMVGSNLESENSLGTEDLHEIGDAIKESGSSESGVKILLETGGCKKWGGDFDIDPDKIQRFEVGAHELSLKDELELSNMSKPETLADFMNWGVNAYPADHYDLILWNHGGGSILGFGADEQFSGYMMRLQQLKKAFEAVDRHFDFVGFDACLMGTVETACMLAPFADYLIASEEMEPGKGWYYTNWVKMLLEDPGLSPEKLGRQIVDDFASSNEKSNDIYTLSLIDLKQVGKVYDALIDFASNADTAMEQKKYATISKARSDARSFGDGNYEQVDIIDFAERSLVTGKEDLKKAVSDAVVYFKTNMKGANGMAMYYPDRNLEKYDQMLGLFDTLKFDPVYTKSLSGFCTIMAQSDDKTRSGSGFSKKKWYRQEMARLYEQDTDLGLPEKLPYREVDGKYVIDITPEQLDKMTYCGLEVWLDTGEGYMEMGVNIWGDDKDDDSITANYDNSWVTLDDVFVPFYMQDLGMRTDGSAYEYGYVPAILNDKDYIWIRVEFIQPEQGEGWATVQGYWIVEEMEEEGGDGIRNLKQLKAGDTLDYVSFLHEYGSTDSKPCQMGDRVTVPEEGLKVGYLLMDEPTTIIRFLLEDVYKNTYYTDWLPAGS
ncbi:clostripain family protease [Lachnospiraceae bacterium JC7]|nr:clostripain family protease [Lachnospiraceae bacterium JC7]